MRRLPGILLATGAILIVVVALLISGLRLVLPELNHYRPQLLEKVQAIAGVPVEADYVQGSWETFGPTLEARNIRLALPKARSRSSGSRWRWTCGNPCCIGAGSSAISPSINCSSILTRRSG